MSLEEFSSVLDALSEALVAIDKEGIIVLFNRRAAELSQRSAAEAIGKPVGEVMQNCRLPEVMRGNADEPHRREEVGGTAVIASRMIVRDPGGKVRGAVTIFQDMSEVQALANEIRNLKETRELTEAIIRCSQDAISVANERGETVLINPAYSQLVGLSEEHVLHKSVTVDIAEGESVHLRVQRTGEPIRGARLRLGPGGREVVVNAAPLIVNGEPRGSVAVIQDLSEICRVSTELAEARQIIRRLESKHTFDDIVGDSRAIRKAKELAMRAAKTPVTVLLRGESGTGKELFAHAIHHASDRGDKPFIRVNCAAIPKELLESELFGYEPGAFTGARKEGKKGYFEEADGGTLFLDEVADAPVELQAKLLRSLQEREVLRIGSSRPRRVDVRLIAATNADLEQMMERNEFRQDLYYRLNVMPIVVPALRERKEDIPLLANYLLARVSQDYYQRTLKELAPETIEYMKKYAWPGNIRELENAIGRGLINVQPDDAAIEPAHIQVTPTPGPASHDLPSPYLGGTYADLRNAWERNLLRSALEVHGGSRNEAAKSLGISIRNFYYKLKEHGLA
ncbi:MAG: sigma-54-dependent transcriptional regulator [Deltaproteobacteria bacterium]|nr:sigma-54-dependent transcriptional regulator [Deltaproteobacteria bacterium]